MKTLKKRMNTNNKTIKNNNCPVSLKPFEKEFSQGLAKKESKKLRNIETLKKTEFAKELLSRFSPKSIKPQNNYYDYINYTWLKNVSLEKQQKYITQIDDFRLAQDKVYTQLNDIIVDYYNTHNDKLAKNLRNYHKSIIDMNSISYSKKLAQEAIQTIDNFIKNDNPWALLGFFNSDEMINRLAPFVWSLNPDDKDPKIYKCYIDAVNLPILDYNVYFDGGSDIKYKINYRNKYDELVKKIFDTTLGKNDFNHKDCLDVQLDMYNVMGCTDITKEEKSYNRVTKEDAIKKYGFDWDEFSKYLGFKKTPDFFISLLSSIYVLYPCLPFLSSISVQ